MYRYRYAQIRWSRRRYRRRPPAHTIHDIITFRAARVLYAHYTIRSRGRHQRATRAFQQHAPCGVARRAASRPAARLDMMMMIRARGCARAHHQAAHTSTTFQHHFHVVRASAARVRGGGAAGSFITQSPPPNFLARRQQRGARAAPAAGRPVRGGRAPHTITTAPARARPPARRHRAAAARPGACRAGAVRRRRHARRRGARVSVRAARGAEMQHQQRVGAPGSRS